MLKLDVALVLHLLSATVAGGLIGMERSYHGRPAGFRTHALVCTASALLMTVTLYQSQWFPSASIDSVRMDPTRIAQGIMTGIGFLGAGVIMKEGLSIRGLTTAASIWMTAAIGILCGIGFYLPAVLATVIALGVLGAFRWVEQRMPTLYYAQLIVRFHRDALMPESDVLALIRKHGFSVANLSYRLEDDGSSFEYRMTVRASGPVAASRLSESLQALPPVREFRISPSGD